MLNMEIQKKTDNENPLTKSRNRMSRRIRSHKTNYGIWTAQELEAFDNVYAVYGNSWTTISKHITTRTVTQIRYHAHNIESKKLFDALPRSNTYRSIPNKAVETIDKKKCSLAFILN